MASGVPGCLGRGLSYPGACPGAWPREDVGSLDKVCFQLLGGGLGFWPPPVGGDGGEDGELSSVGPVLRLSYKGNKGQRPCGRGGVAWPGGTPAPPPTVS